MNPQTYARTTGVLYLITFATAIPALLLFGPVLDDPGGYVTGAGEDNRILFGGFLELLLIVANVGTALALFPVLRWQNEGLALGYVAARIVECIFIAIGLVAVLAVVTLRQDASEDAGALTAAAEALVAVKDWTFLFGPGFVVGIGNGLMLGYLMYRSGLMPPRLALFGLVGGPLVCISGVLVLFDVFELGSAGQFVMTIPEIIWELSIGIYLTVWGFRPTAVKALIPASARP